MLPQVERVKDKGFEILYLTDYVDEFALKTLMMYDEKAFVNICADDADFDTQEEKDAVKAENENNNEMLTFMKDTLSTVTEVRFTNKLKNYPSCLTNEGEISAEMEKVLRAMPGSGNVAAEYALEINVSHPIADRIKELFESDKEKLKTYTKLLYNQARLIGGLTIENPAEFASLISELM